MVRTNTDVSYGSDYEELAALKRLADELQICILLVHHLRRAYHDRQKSQANDEPMAAAASGTGHHLPKPQK